MQKRTREILALCLLVILGVGVMAVMGWYLLAGHSWNKAASHIDDLAGSMEGYTIVLFENGIQAQAQKDDAETPGRVPRASASEDAGSRTEDLASSDAAARSASSAKSAKKKLITLDRAAAVYREKGATTVIVHADDLGLYDDPVIVSKNGKRIAIASLAGRSKATKLRSFTRSLKARKVDTIIGITVNRAALHRPMPGIDLALYAFKADIPGEGEYCDPTFCVGLPPDGQVQAVVMAPSGVMTAKIIDTL